MPIPVSPTRWRNPSEFTNQRFSACAMNITVDDCTDGYSRKRPEIRRVICAQRSRSSSSLAAG